MGDRLSRKERKKKAAYRERRGKGKLVIKKEEEKESRLSRKERKKKAGYEERRGKRKQVIKKGEEK